MRYTEIHGVDEIVMMEKGAHKRLHQRLRRESKCSVSATKLNAISKLAHQRTRKCKETTKKRMQKHNKCLGHKINRIQFTETIGKNIQLLEQIRVNPNTGSVCYTGCLHSINGMRLKYIDI